MMLITTLVVSFCKDGGVSVNVKLWFLVACDQEQAEVRECVLLFGAESSVFEVAVQKFKNQDI